MSMQSSESKISSLSARESSRLSVPCRALCCQLLVLGWIGIFPVTVFAQSNVGEQNPVVELTEADPLSNDTTQIILRSVRDSNPQTAIELAKAAAIMIDVELYNDAKIYLGKITALGLDDDTLFELQDAIGSDFFASIHANSMIQPEGRTLAKKVLVSATKVGLSPERMNQLIKTLNDPDISVRSTAFRKLRRLGEPAVAELLNVFAQDDRVPDFPGVRGALKYMGSEMQGPLLGGARADDIQVQTESIRVLARHATGESLDVMMRAYLSPKAPEYIRRVALDALTRQNYPPDPDRIEKRLYDRSVEYLMGKRQISGALIGDVTVWNWDSATSRLVPEKVDPDTASRITASRRAADLYEIRPDLGRNRELYLLTQFEAAKRVAGASRRCDTEGLIKRLNPTAAELDSVLSQSLKLELVPAAVCCCEILATNGDASLLSGSTTGQPRPLVQAILFGDRHLQFAAMQAIAKIDPTDSYAGSSYMSNLAIYLAQSQNRPAGLVGHNREDIGQTYAATLGSAGLFGITAGSSREFFNVATNNPDVSVLLVTDTLDKPDYGHLIQQLRTDWRTRRLPIALLYRDVNRNRQVAVRMGNDPLYTSAPFSSDPELVLSHVTRLNEKVEPWSVSNYDRRRHAAAAIQWLAKIATDRENYQFYNLGSSQNQLANLLYTPGFSENASKILASLGTPRSQRELVNFASQTSLPLNEREQAVAAFVQSVENGGTLLTTDEIRQQYDRYNASENEPEETQKVLGAILDAIEKRKKSASTE